MKIAVIGAGNMGGAVARALASKDLRVAVANPTEGKLDAIKREYPEVETTTDNRVAARSAGLVILAVKPWLIEQVVAEISADMEEDAIVASLAPTFTLEQLRAMTGRRRVARIMPNTAVTVGKGLTFVSCAEVADGELLRDVLAPLGSVEVVEERLMPVAMAVGSCGIAYALRYIRAVTEGAVEAGAYAHVAQRWAAETLIGAAALALKDGAHPEAEIDRVTTPGGVTIKGLNAMERLGFTSAVIAAIKESAK